MRSCLAKSVRRMSDDASLAQQIRLVLPKLRRFGQMLIGSSVTVDKCIEECLREVIDDPECIVPDDDVAVSVFSLFSRAVAKTENPNFDTLMPTGLADWTDAFLAELNFEERQAFLLLYVELFNRLKTAKIIGVKLEELAVFEHHVARKCRATVREPLPVLRV